MLSRSFGWDFKLRSILDTHAFDLVGIKRRWFRNSWCWESVNYKQIPSMQSVNNEKIGKMQFERWLKDNKVPKYVTMRQLILVLGPGSALSSRQLIGCESSIGCEPLRDLVDQPDIRRYVSFHSIHSFTTKRTYLKVHPLFKFKLFLEKNLI